MNSGGIIGCCHFDWARVIKSAIDNPPTLNLNLLEPKAISVPTQGKITARKNPSASVDRPFISVYLFGLIT